MDFQAFNIEDVEKLKANPSEESKIELIRKLHETFQMDSLADEERQIAEEIIRYLAADISSRIRYNISEKFAGSGSLPYDVALKLASDLEDIVAVPVIENSKQLKDSDLIKVIRDGNPTRQKAVAKRENLSEQVNTTIITEANEDAVKTLLKNEKTELTTNNTEQLIKSHGTNQTLVKTLIHHRKVGIEQAHELLVRVSDDLQKMIIVEYNIPANTVNNLIHNSKEWVILNMIKAHAERQPNSLPLKDIIEKLHRENEISFSLLIKALSLGNLTFFEAAIAKMADIPVENVQKLLWNAGDRRGFIGLFEKCDLPQSMAEAIYKLLRIVHEETSSGQEIEKAPYRIFQKISAAAKLEDIENIDYLVTIVAYNLRKSNA